MKRKKLWIGLGVVLLGAALVVANLAFRRDSGPSVTVEAVGTRDLESIVSASGTIQAMRMVEISAEVPGRITRLAVREGQRVKAGEFLLEIDPRQLESEFEQRKAGLMAIEWQLTEQEAQIEAADENVQLAREELRRQEELWAQELTTRQALDQARNTVKVREAELRARQQALKMLDARLGEQRAAVANADYQLSRVRMVSPIDGLVVRRNVEEGETAVLGTMNNPGTVLLTIADMSVLEAELEIDETDIPSIEPGQPATVTIDALARQTFEGKVTEVGNSPIQEAGTAAASGQQATTFEVVVTLDAAIAGVRPGFTCAADITTATRETALTVPIQAMAVRELVFDDDGNIVREDRERENRGRSAMTASAEELPAGQTRKETEGVFLLRDDRAVFVPVETGIAGDRYFEVLSGLQEGDQVVTGPFASVRDLQDGDRIQVQASGSTGR